MKKDEPQFAVCLDNSGYRASLEVGKLYQVIRDKEAEAQVMAKQFEYMTAMAQLAARDEENRTKIAADLQKQAADLDTKRFLAGQDMAIKARSQALKEVEAEQAIKEGKGW